MGPQGPIPPRFGKPPDPLRSWGQVWQSLSSRVEKTPTLAWSGSSKEEPSLVSASGSNLLKVVLILLK
jgi:hypothetical protein